MEQDRIMAALMEVRERVSDSARLVIDPAHTYESADGERGCYLFSTPPEGFCRACLLGHAWLAADAQNLDRIDLGERIDAAALTLGHDAEGTSFGNPATVALEQGVTVEVVDEAIRQYTAERDRELTGATA